MKSKKSLRTQLFISIFIIILFMAGAAAAYYNRFTLFNTYALYTMSPKEYYSSIEKLTLEVLADRLSPYLQPPTERTAYEVTTDFTFHRETLDTVLQTALGTKLIEMEAILKFPIESAGLETVLDYNKHQMSNILKLRVNDTNLLTTVLFSDKAEKKLLLQLQELSPAYISQPLTTNAYDLNLFLAFLKLVTSDQNSDLIKHYGNLMIDQIQQVELIKNVTISIDSLSLECNELKITLSENELSSIFDTVLNEAKKDPVIQNALAEYELTTDDFEKELADNKKDLMEYFRRNAPEKLLELHIYVDHSGRMVRREVTFPGSPASLSYTFLSKDPFDEYCFRVTGMSGKNLLQLNGSQTHLKDPDTYHGSIDLEYNTPSSTKSSNQEFQLTYEDVKFEFTGSRILQYGNYTLSSSVFQGIQITLKNDVFESLQQNHLVFRLGTSPVITADFSSNYVPNYDVMVPSQTAAIYDQSQLQDYLDSFDIPSYLNSVAEKLGMDKTVVYGLVPIIENLIQ